MKKLTFKQILLRVFLTPIVFIVTMAFLMNISYFGETFILRDYVSDSTWKETIGTLSKISKAPRGNECMFDYEYKGEIFIGVASGGYDIDEYYGKRGDMFALRINPKSPDKYLPVRWKPVFLPNEKTSFTVGKVIYIRNIVKNGFILFHNFFWKPLDNETITYKIGYEYFVNNERYERGQYLSPYLDSLSEKIRSGQKFQVEYLVNDPKRAIIHIDR